MGTLEQHLGRRIQELRKSADLTQQELADRTKLDQKYLPAIQNTLKSPSLAVLAKLMTALDVEPPELFNFGLRKKGPRKSKTDEAMSALFRRLAPSKKQLVLGLLREVSRWNHRDKQ